MNASNGTAKCARLKEPGRYARPGFQIVRLKGGEKLLAIVILSRSFYGFQIHWDHILRRSERCTGDNDTCPGCQVHKPGKELWYLTCACPEKGVFFLEMPPDAARLFLAQLPKGEVLRGLTVNASRTKADNGRLHMEIMRHRGRNDRLPPDVDPEESLAALWDWPRK